MHVNQFQDVCTDVTLNNVGGWRCIGCDYQNTFNMCLYEVEFVYYEAFGNIAIYFLWKKTITLEENEILLKGIHTIRRSYKLMFEVENESSEEFARYGSTCLRVTLI